MSERQAILLVERHAENILLLRLNRPEKRNALATDLLAELAGALDRAAAEADIRAVIVTGNDKVFAAGADINELAARDVSGALSDPRPAIWSRIRGFAKPLIAAVEGWSLGAGNELVMCCDFVVSAKGAKFGQPETNLGIIPGAGGTATLPRLVGRATAMKMVLLGEPLSAEEARAAGLVSEVTEDGHAVAGALALAEKIARRAPVAMQQSKAMVRAAFETHQSAHLAMERQAFSALFGTRDKVEGTTAFFEKRSPEWQGR